MPPFRLVLAEDAAHLEVECPCGELVALPVLEPYGTCPRCGELLEPDTATVVPTGTA